MGAISRRSSSSSGSAASRGQADTSQREVDNTSQGQVQQLQRQPETTNATANATAQCGSKITGVSRDSAGVDKGVYARQQAELKTCFYVLDELTAATDNSVSVETESLQQQQRE